MLLPPLLFLFDRATLIIYHHLPRLLSSYRGPSSLFLRSPSAFPDRFVSVHIIAQDANSDYLQSVPLSDRTIFTGVYNVRESKSNRTRSHRRAGKSYICTHEACSL